MVKEPHSNLFFVFDQWFSLFVSVLSSICRKYHLQYFWPLFHVGKELVSFFQCSAGRPIGMHFIVTLHDQWHNELDGCEVGGYRFWQVGWLKRALEQARNLHLSERSTFSRTWLCFKSFWATLLSSCCFSRKIPFVYSARIENRVL